MADDQLGNALGNLVHVPGWLAAVAVTALGWLGKRHVHRIDKLEEEQTKLEQAHAKLQTKEEAVAGRKEVRDEIRDMSNRLDEKIDRVLLHLVGNNHNGVR